VFEQASLGERQSALSDWILRGGIALVFVVEGADKFGPASGWIRLFQQIGFGEWFRYFTGVVEVLGGVLVLIPWTVTVGLALLACTMGSAAVILAFVVGRPWDSVFSGAFLIALVVFWWHRQSSGSES
jgi:putative oxidoreductase